MYKVTHEFMSHIFFSVIKCNVLDNLLYV